MKMETIGDTMLKCNNCGNKENFQRWAIYRTSGTERRLEALDNEENMMDTIEYGDEETNDSDFNEWEEDIECRECRSTNIDTDYEEDVKPTPQKVNENGDYWS